MKKRKIAIYPGTFDPMTMGHFDIIRRSAHVVDELIIAVSSSESKKPLFSLNERINIINLYLKESKLSDNIRVQGFTGLLVNFAKEVDANLIIRGIRAVSDFEYEFQMACMNSRLDRNIETIFLPASEEYQFISSRFVKEIASLGGDISSFVIPEVSVRVREFYK